MDPITGLIFNIQRFSVHDGPGIRTTVFYKGCPLRCFWCHNPEGWKGQTELQFFPQRCIACGACVEACEQGAHQVSQGQHRYDRTLCIACGTCVVNCCSEALQLAGRRVTVEETLAEVLRDRPFFDSQGGGVTLSGGEPLQQREFTLALLQRLKEEEIHTAIETTAFFSWERLAEMLQLVDWVMMDLKHYDSQKHRAATGVPNEGILMNAQRLSESGKPVIFRIPVIPTVNDNLEDIGAIAAFVKQISANRPAGAKPLALELLPFHRLAGDKYRSLGMEYLAEGLEPPGREHLERLLAAAQRYVPGAFCR